MIKTPLLAADLFDVQNDFTKVPYPVYASVKIDGIRAFTSPQGLLSRSRKPIGNAYIRRRLRSLDFYVDGELVAVDSNGNPKTYRETSSAVRSADGEPEFKFMVFDYVYAPDANDYYYRNVALSQLCASAPEDFIVHVAQTVLKSAEEAEAYYKLRLHQGHEGIMLRGIHSPYKFGRSTLNEFFLTKVKPSEIDTAVVIGFVEGTENTNPTFLDEAGKTKRSTDAAGLIPNGMLGAFEVSHPKFGTFNIGGGPGLTHLLRKLYWDKRANLLGNIVQFKYDRAETSGYGKPRSPQFLQLLGTKAHKDLLP